jgi:hypothetical protein
MWCIGTLTEEYRRRMYNLLALYAKPLREDEPVICIDEKSLQLLAHSREPLPMVPGAPAKQDYEYARKGTTNLFVAVEPALLKALESGQLGGCALDVGRAPDQMPSMALARHPRVIATPHIGGLTPQAIEHQSMETVSQVAALLRGQIPNGAVNAQQATRFLAWTKGVAPRGCAPAPAINAYTSTTTTTRSPAPSRSSRHTHRRRLAVRRRRRSNFCGWRWCSRPAQHLMALCARLSLAPMPLRPLTLDAGAFAARHL